MNTSYFLCKAYYIDGIIDRELFDKLTGYLIMNYNEKVKKKLSEVI